MQPDLFPITRVVHCKKEPFDVYIGRPSRWGNPYKIGEDGTREEVIEKYRKYATKCLADDIRRELRGKALGCHCHPKPCHGDVLAEIANAQTRVE